MKVAHQEGFTLAELLISMAMIGVIAAFTIPKVMQAAGERENKARLQEAMATVEGAWYALKIDDSYDTGNGKNLYSNLITGSSLGTSKMAATLTGTGLFSFSDANHPCANANVADLQGYAQFANGLVIVGLNSTGAGYDFIDDVSADSSKNYLLCFDLNGNKGPNTAGVDVFVGNFNQSGNFDGVGASFSAASTSRNFNWGSETQQVYARGAGGTAISGTYAPTSASARVGAYLY
jgi:prepilin-type N-terminal cleavage/methylation domain-containing protein